MTQENQAGEHGNGEGELRFKPPDIERSDQCTHNRAQRRIAAQQHAQQPGARHNAGQIPADGGDRAKRGSDAFAAFKTKEYRPDMAQTGGDGNKPQPERGHAQRISAPDGEHPFQNIKNQYRYGCSLAANS
ncbi:hypothetical protein D3C72_1945620 [compost metagenome]